MDALIAPGSVTGDPTIDALLRRALIAPGSSAAGAPAGATPPILPGPAYTPTPAAAPAPAQAAPIAPIAPGQGRSIDPGMSMRAKPGPAIDPGMSMPAKPGPSIDPGMSMPPGGGGAPSGPGARPTLDPNAGKPSILRRILASAAAGMIGYDNPREGVEVGREVMNAPRARAQEQFQQREKDWQGQQQPPGTREIDGQTEQWDPGKGQWVTPAGMTPKAQAIAPGATPPSGVTTNSGDDAAANTAASLQKIAGDQAAGRSVYGGPTTAAGAAGGAAASHGPVVRAYVNGDGKHVNVFRDGTEQVTEAVQDPRAEQEHLAEKLASMRNDLKRAASGGGGAAGATAETDLGAAPAGKKEGSTGTLLNGNKVVVKNGHLWEQLPTPGGRAAAGAGGVTNTTRSRGEMAESVIEQIPTINSEIDGISSEVGLAAGRWNDWWVNRAGANDPKFATLSQDLSLFASAVAVAHFGARGGGGTYRKELEKQFGEAQSPEDLKARIKAADRWMEGYARQAGGAR